MGFGTGHSASCAGLNGTLCSLALGIECSWSLPLRCPCWCGGALLWLTYLAMIMDEMASRPCLRSSAYVLHTPTRVLLLYWGMMRSQLL